MDQYHNNMNNNRRRRKQRPHYGRRMVEVCRSMNGFGFTISGQQPCILSCIVPNSPADSAGLRAGDFLISVNGLNVSKLPHELVVHLINDTVGTIQLTIAENYFSDSSDDEVWTKNGISPTNGPTRPRRSKYPHHRLRANKQQTGDKNLTKIRQCTDSLDGLNGNNSLQYEEADEVTAPSISSAHNIIHSPNASNIKDITNVSAMVPPARSDNDENQLQLEYRVVVGYLGTIEMPKQIATSSKLQTVRSCIRKMRQEKRQPAIVLMQILPNCLKLYNSENVLIAKYPSNRLVYVSNAPTGSTYMENDTRFFGLVTSSAYQGESNRECLSTATNADNVISNSCHVFVIDIKLVDHIAHLQRAEQFSIVCTNDATSNSCFEFPNSAEYVVNLIRSMYSLNCLPPNAPSAMVGQPNATHRRFDGPMFRQPQFRQQSNNSGNSPQLSNNSDITSSNSDSGIGFHNDFTNISDRIVVVDFPGAHNHQFMMQRAHMNMSPRKNVRPVPYSAAVHNIRSTDYNLPTVSQAQPSTPVHAKSKSLDMTTPTSSLEPEFISNRPNLRMIRAMPDPQFIPPRENAAKALTSPEKYETVYGGNLKQNSPKSFNEPRSCSRRRRTEHYLPPQPPSRDQLLSTRSCDNLMTNEVPAQPPQCRRQLQRSFDDVSLLGEAPPPPLLARKPRVSLPAAAKSDNHIFVAPQPPSGKSFVKKSKPSIEKLLLSNKNDQLLTYKLSPKVFGVTKPPAYETAPASKPKRHSLGGGGRDKHNKLSTSLASFSIWGSLQSLPTVSAIPNQQNATKKEKKVSLEPAYSEPDLTSRTLPNNSSPFRRWGQTSFRSRVTDNDSTHIGQRRPSSLAASETDVYRKSVHDDDGHETKSLHSDLNGYGGTQYVRNGSGGNEGVVASWGTSFEKLLGDPAGLHAFAVFLKKEFSAENIYFWTACERYSMIEDAGERSREALAIFTKHLGVGASEPVNVDSKARTIAESNLNFAERDLFMQAQKQIFNLMKFDSYQRFIRSDVYKSCQTAEAQNQPLPYPGDQLDSGLRIYAVDSKAFTSSSISSKLKKSLSNAEDRRRKSLLPWHRKTRCKSKDRSEETTSDLADGRLRPCDRSQSDIHSSRSSLSSFDAVLSSRHNPDSADESSNKSSLCRVILSDGATTIVQTKTSETAHDLFNRLLEKRGICYHAYEGFVVGTSKPIDLELPSMHFAGKEILIEQRVVFKLDLPNRKIISVKSKPCKALGEVLRPILQKYNYRLELVTVISKTSTRPLLMNDSVTTTDGQRLQVISNEDGKANGSSEQLNSPQRSIKMTPAYVINANSPPSAHQQNTLDEITNKVFNELLQRRVDAHSQDFVLPHQSVLQQNQYQQQSQKRISDNEDAIIRSDDMTSESSSGAPNRLREIPIPKVRTFVAANKHKKGVGTCSGLSAVQNPAATANVEPKRPLIAKWKTGVKLQCTTASSENNDLLEGLKRAQRFRLEDQRGTEINFELPDFLKDNDINARNKFRKTKAGSSASEEAIEQSTVIKESPPEPQFKLTPPQPAPRFLNKLQSNMPLNNDDTPPVIHDSRLNSSSSSTTSSSMNGSNSSAQNHYENGEYITSGGLKTFGTPPPLPPKPKIKPSHWPSINGNATNVSASNVPQTKDDPPMNSELSPRRITQTTTIGNDSNSGKNMSIQTPRSIYLDQPNSSFV